MRVARSAFRYFPDASHTIELCHSAFGGPWPGMEPVELDHMRDLMFDLAAFASLRILAFSLRPTSFDLLVEAPVRIGELSMKEMTRRIDSSFSDSARDEILLNLSKKDPDTIRKTRQYFGSVSFFIKRFKQMSARAYHRHHQTNGTLWEARYVNTYVEAGHAARVIAAWIDHGGVRMRHAESPENDTHCMIGCAAAGNLEAQAMIRSLYLEDLPNAKWPTVIKAWQDFCAGEPEHPKTRVSNLSKTPPLNRAALLRHMVPHFHSGLAIGSHDFAKRLFELNPNYFSDGRETGPRFITGQNDPDLFTLRDKGDLRKPPRAQRARRQDQTS